MNLQEKYKELEKRVAALEASTDSVSLSEADLLFQMRTAKNPAAVLAEWKRTKKKGKCHIATKK